MLIASSLVLLLSQLHCRGVQTGVQLRGNGGLILCAVINTVIQKHRPIKRRSALRRLGKAHARQQILHIAQGPRRQLLLIKRPYLGGAILLQRQHPAKGGGKGILRPAAELGLAVS